MNFNVKKCGVLSITRKRTPRIYQYKLLNDEIPRVNEYKYLGVTITADLRWNKHCQTIRHKASRTLGLIRRTLSPCSTEVKARAYTALVRPATRVWLGGMESIHCFQYQLTWASTKISGSFRPGWLQANNIIFSSSISTWLGTAFTLAAFLPNVYFSTKSITIWSTCHSHQWSPKLAILGRQDHELKYTVPRATIDPYKYSFYPRAIRTWNHLPRAVVITADPTLFRGAALPILRTMQPPVGSAMI